MHVSSRIITIKCPLIRAGTVTILAMLLAACIAAPGPMRPFTGPVMMPQSSDLAEAFDVVCRNYRMGPDDVLSIAFHTDWAVPAGAYTLDALDEVEVQFLLDPAMNRRATIRPDGMMTMPGIGDVKAMGKTPEELARKIENRLRRAQIIKPNGDKDSPDHLKAVTVAVTGFYQKSQKLIESLCSHVAERKGQITVNPDGTIDLPLLKERILAAGHTVADVERTINRVLQTGPAKPVIASLALHTARSRKVYILGQVNSPGAFEIKQPITAVQALALAGGHRTDLADLSSVILISRDVHGKPIGRRLDLNRLFDAGDLSSAILVKPYDVIYVPSFPICDMPRFMDHYHLAASGYPWLY